MITTWRWNRGDQLPNGRQLGTEWLSRSRRRTRRSSRDRGGQPGRLRKVTRPLRTQPYGHAGGAAQPLPAGSPAARRHDQHRGRRRHSSVPAAFQRLRPTMRRSLTWDRAVDMTQHADFTAATGIPVYFCDAYCRGSTAATRTATDCCGNTSRRKPTYPNTTQITSTPRSTAQQPTSTEPGMANSS
jgi:hypothetical protein